MASLAVPKHMDGLLKMIGAKGRRAHVGLALGGLLLVGCAAPKDETANWTPEKLYAEAKDELNSNNFERANKLFEKLEGRATGTLMSQQAQLERAYAMYRSGERTQALSTIERFIKIHPSSPAIDYALYLQALINFNDNLGILGSLANQDLSERDQQASRDSLQAFRQLVEQYPQSRYAPDAKARVDYITNALAAYEVHVARYYYLRGAYVAAANRAQQTIAEFQTAPATEEALHLMVQSYERLGLNDLRDDTRRVLDRNFPNSRVRVEDQGRGSRRWWQFW